MKTRFIIGLFIILTMLPICLSSFKTISNINIDFYEIDDEIMINKLRRVLLIGYNFEVFDDEIYFRYQTKQCNLYYTNNHLIMTPGTNIFLENIDSVKFYFKDDYLYLKYSRGSNFYEKAILHKRFCLDVFSDDFID